MFILSCNTNGDTKSNGQDSLQKDTLIKVAVDTAKRIDTTKLDVINPISVNTIPKEINYVGKLTEGKMWTDKSGKHYAFVGSSTTGEYLSESWTSKLYWYYATTTNNGNVFSIESFYDSVQIASELSYVKKSLKVIDVDKDGEAEVIFFYRLMEDGADPMPLKMLVYTGGKQYFIRGLIPRSVTDLNLYQKESSKTSFKKEVEEFANKEWNAVATGEMKRIIGSDVTKSEDFPIK